MDSDSHSREADAGPAFATSAFWRAMPGGMRRRWWLFRPLDLIARHLPVFGRPHGALVVRMDGIGDMVLFRGALDHYAAALGIDRSEITVLGCESWGPLSDIVFAGYRVIAIDEHDFARRPLYRFRVSLMVRRLNPEVTILDSYLRRAMMADSLAWVAAAPRTVSSLPFIGERNRQEFLFYLSQADEIVVTGDYPTHEIVRHFNFVSRLAGTDIAAAPPRIEWRGDGLRHPRIPAGPYAVLNPGSNEYGRRWPLAKYLAIAGRLRKRGLGVVFVGGHGEKPGEVVGEDAGIVDLMGQTSLAQLLDIIQGAALVVSNDTGPAHLAIALGAPTLVVVGGGHFGCFVPYPDAIRPANARFVYERMDCYHCFWNCPKRASKFEVFPCVEAVAVDAAWAEAEKLLDA